MSKQAAKRVFAINEETSGGGVSYCWVEQQMDGYYLCGSELGHMAGPYSDPVSALFGSGCEFGNGHVGIESSLTPTQFEEICKGLLLENICSLVVNGQTVEARDPAEMQKLYVR